MFFNWLFKDFNILIAGWIFLSVCMLICIPAFHIDGYISQPQHGHFDHFAQVSCVIQHSGKVFWYRLYFGIDFFWALYLLLIIGQLTKDNKNNSLLEVGKSRTWASYLFVTFAAIAFLLDITEGIFYVFYWSSGLKYISLFKLLAYLICIGFFFYWFLKKILFPKMKQLRRFLSTSLFSIVFIFLVYGLVTLMPQGRTLVVDLFYHPLNLLVLFILLTFLSIIISHYPVYVDIWLNGNNECVKLTMYPKSRFLGAGLIYYDTLQGSDKYEMYNDALVKKLRRSMGILLYVAVFTIFIGVATNIYEFELNAGAIAVLIFVITVFVYDLYGQRYVQWKKALRDHTKPEEQAQTVKKIIKYVTSFPFYLIGCIMICLVSAAVAAAMGWSRSSLWIFLIALGCQMFLYIQFKISRTYLKYVYYSKKLLESNREMFDMETLGVFDKFDKNRARGNSSFYYFFGRLSDNIQYLRLMRFVGVISLIALILANFFFAFASWFNPINIILLYIIFFYSFGTILFKHILFYHRQKHRTGLRNFYRYGVPLLIILLIAIATYTGSLGNNLHALTIVPQKHPPIDHNSYLASMLEDRQVPGRNYFFLGSYGGGLKANLWNLLLLHRLEEQSDHRFFGRSIAMSGVSGGAVGIGNFVALLNQEEDIPEKIYEIGRSNVLSNELTYLLGKDWIREYLPWSESGDRAFKSMEVHARNTGMVQFNTIGFSDYWWETYTRHHGKFPALIMNSTAVGGKQGVASTVDFPKEAFPGSIRVDKFTNRYKDSTLTYYGAISTTNRFPLFSPTAKIPTKGSFLDGGYFENSGMLSLLGIYDILSTDSLHAYRSRIQPVFINIINSSDYYVTAKLDEWDVKTEKLKESGEFPSILETVMSIDKLPGYVGKKISARKYVLEEIMMPHKITYEKVREILKADVKNPIRLMARIKQHNDRIDSVLKAYCPYKYETWGVVQPPLARLLSDPAVRYQEAMVNGHPEVLAAIERILTYIETTQKVDQDFQERLKHRVKSLTGEGKFKPLLKDCKETPKSTLQ